MKKNQESRKRERDSDMEGGKPDLDPRPSNHHRNTHTPTHHRNSHASPTKYRRNQIRRRKSRSRGERNQGVFPLSLLSSGDQRQLDPASLPPYHSLSLSLPPFLLSLLIIIIIFIFLSGVLDFLGFFYGFKEVIGCDELILEREEK